MIGVELTNGEITNSGQRFYLPLQFNHAFDVVRLWEQVEQVRVGHAISRRDKGPEIARQSRGITRHIHDLWRAQAG